MKNQKNLKPGWRKSLVHSIPSKNENLVIAVKHYRINRYQRFLVIFIFAWFLYFAQLIVSWIAVIANWISRWSHCVNSVQMQSFFRSVYSRTRAKYGDLLRKSPCSARARENRDQKKLRIWTLFTQCVWVG